MLISLEPLETIQETAVDSSMAPPAPPAASDDDKAKKAAEKARREAEFEAQGGAPQKKQLSKAERRAQQEKARSTKEAKKNPKKPPPKPTIVTTHEVGILSHLTPSTQSTPEAEGIPAPMQTLGTAYASGEYDGANDRCRALLKAVRESVADYEPPENAACARDLDTKLRKWAEYLEKCRAPTASTLAALKRLRLVVSTLPPETSSADARAVIESECDRFVEERVDLAVREIARRGAAKIRDGDVVVAYGFADAVEALFREAAESVNFEVVVVDAAPSFSGRRLLNALYAKQIRTTYVRLTAAAPEVERATLVVLGADAVFSNGAVLARAGAFAVAALAKRRHVPVVVTCEAYKCHDRVRLDAVDANELFEVPVLDKEIPPLKHLPYDITPSSYVSAVATEHGLLPPSAVAALIRELAEKETA